MTTELIQLTNQPKPEAALTTNLFSEHTSNVNRNYQPYHRKSISMEPRNLRLTVKRQTKRVPFPTSCDVNTKKQKRKRHKY